MASIAEDEQFCNGLIEAILGRNYKTNMVTILNSPYYIYPESLSSFFKLRYFSNMGGSRRSIYYMNWKWNLLTGGRD